MIVYDDFKSCLVLLNSQPLALARLQNQKAPVAVCHNMQKSETEATLYELFTVLVHPHIVAQGEVLRCNGQAGRVRLQRIPYPSAVQSKPRLHCVDQRRSGTNEINK